MGRLRRFSPFSRAARHGEASSAALPPRRLTARQQWAREVRRDAPFLGYFLLQGFIVLGLRTPRYPDSETYLPLSLTGHAQRLPVVPLLYKALPDDPLRVFGQVLIAAVCWWILAKVAAGLVENRRVAIALRAVLLALGVVGPIANWNSAILSESVAISLTALLIAVWLRYARRPGWRTAGAVVLVTILWTFTRQPHVVLSLFFALAALVAWVVRRTRLRFAVAIALVLTSVAGFAELRNNQTISNGTTAWIIQERVLVNPSYRQWFIDHGMPYTTAIAATAGVIPSTLSLQDVPEFKTWEQTKELHTYLRFILEHPGYTLLGPLPYFSGEQASLGRQNTSIFAGFTQPNPSPSLLSPSAIYGRHRDVIPVVVATLLFEQGQIGDVLLLAALAIALTVAARRRYGPDRRLWVPGLIAASAIPQGYLVWLAGGEAVGELDRLSIVLATSLRISLWIILALAVDRLWRPHRAAAPILT